MEITSPGNAVIDRAVKPQLYAQAGIPHYLRVELSEAGPGAVSYRFTQDHYVEVARADAPRPLVLAEPIAVTLDLAALATATRLSTVLAIRGGTDLVILADAQTTGRPTARRIQMTAERFLVTYSDATTPREDQESFSLLSITGDG